MRPYERLALNDQGFAFDPETGESYTVNATGKAVIDGLRRGEARQAISAAMARRHGVDPAVTDRDVADFLDCLRRLGLA